jgi:hypothetical protein
VWAVDGHKVLADAVLTMDIQHQVNRDSGDGEGACFVSCVPILCVCAICVFRVSCVCNSRISPQPYFEYFACVYFACVIRVCNLRACVIRVWVVQGVGNPNSNTPSPTPGTWAHCRVFVPWCKLCPWTLWTWAWTTTRASCPPWPH